MMLAMKPLGRVIDGAFVGRNNWINIAGSKTVSGFFIATVFVRGGGRGGGGDLSAPMSHGNGFMYGQGGGHGAGNTYSTQTVSDPVITVGAGGGRGVDDQNWNTNGASGGNGSNGGQTSIVYGSTTRTAAGGSIQGGGAWANNLNSTKSNHDPLAYNITGNPNGGTYGRMGGRIAVPGVYLSAQAGVVQLQLVD